MKRAERKARDKFIKEKLSILHKKYEETDYVPSDNKELHERIMTKCRPLFEELQLKKKQKNKK